MIRVAFANRSGDKTGGAEESLALLIRYLPCDFEPHALLFSDGEYASRLRSYGVKTHVVEIDRHLLEATREHPSIRGAAALPQSILKVCRLLQREHIDVVHTNTMKSHLVVAPAARLCRIGSVVHVRDMVNGVGHAAMRFIGSFASEHTIVVSTAVGQWYGFRESRVIPNPISLDRRTGSIDSQAARRRLQIPGDAPLVSIIGRIDRWKGHDLFLRVIARIARSQCIRCAIVGEARFRDADFLPELHDLAQSLGITGITHFIPWQDDLSDAYAATDILCNCTAREAFGRTIAEAAAMGVPAIAFDDGGGADIIENGRTGYLVRSGDEPAFTRAVELLLDRSRIEAFGNAARLAAVRFEPRAHAEAVAQILRGCARTR